MPDDAPTPTPDSDRAPEPVPSVNDLDEPDDLDELPRWPIVRKAAGRKWPQYLPVKRRHRWAPVLIRNGWPIER